MLKIFVLKYFNKSVNEVNTDELEKDDFLIFPEKGNQIYLNHYIEST